MRDPREYIKAILGFLIPFAGAIVTALATNDDGITSAEWLGAAATAVITGGAVFQVRNARPEAKHAKAEPDAGLSALEALVAVIAICAVIFLVIWLADRV
jgi:drug/metabolite transporter (DMT)-like permease